MKRLMSASLVAILAATLVACGGGGSTGETGSGTSTGTTSTGTGTKQSNATPEEAFTWNDNVITGLSNDFPSDTKSVVIPARAEGFDGGVFEETTTVEEVSFESDKDITIDFAVANNTSITSVTLPAELTEVGQFAFAHAEALESIVIPASVEVIADQAFVGNDSLTKVEMSEGVKSIGWNAFRFARALTELTLADSIESFGDNAFEGVDSLEAFTLPKSLTTVGTGVLTGDKLTDVHVPAEVELDESSTAGFARLNQRDVHVVEGSFMDENFDKFFPMSTKVVE